MRTCTRCKLEKDVSEFAKTETRCRECNRERAREYREKYPDRVKASQAAYNKTEKAKIRTQRWRENGGAEYQAKWQRENKDKRAAAGRRSYRKNIEKERIRYTINNHKRRVATAGFVSAADLRRLREQPCVGCGTTDNLTVDHIIPLSRGGRHTIGNLQSLCGSCNSSKHARFMVEWRSHMNLLRTA